LSGLPVCVDASAYIGLILNDYRRPLVVKLWTRWFEEGRQLVAPPIFYAEVCSTLRLCTWKGDISSDAALAALSACLRSPVEIWDSPVAIQTRAFALASQFNQPRAYDAQYLAVAELTRGELWTADKRLVNSVAGQLSWVHSIEEAAL
jgi:predicted nucleic acid-binding protein